MFQIVIEASVDAVWRDITRTDAPIACFFNNRMVLGRGGLTRGTKLAMRSADSKYTGVVGTILECDPPRRFAHTFRFTNFDDPECRVTYELRAIAGERGPATEFTLIVDDLPLGTKTAKQMVQGGTMIVNTLKSTMETGRPSAGIRLLFAIFKIITPLVTPKKSRSEHWPVD